MRTAAEELGHPDKKNSSTVCEGSLAERQKLSLEISHLQFLDKSHTRGWHHSLTCDDLTTDTTLSSMRRSTGTLCNFAHSSHTILVVLNF